ncbi:MAG: hypothetical protein LBF16_15090 [Pseudomonadales bacterium]|jgi:outer membrane lipoprotein SlyB|nr:hypothetical protein [Pseudomonadales bacterium]
MRIRFLTLSTVLLGILLQGCGTPESVFGKEPIVDTSRINQQQYAADLAQCRTFADQVQTGRQTVVSAATAAAVGSALGAVVGNRSTVQTAAGVGGVLGGVSGAGSAMSERQQVLRNCLTGRGYRLLN